MYIILNTSKKYFSVNQISKQGIYSESQMLKYIFVFGICTPFHIFTISRDVFPLKSHTKITNYPGYDLTQSTKHMNNKTTVFSHEYQSQILFLVFNFFEAVQPPI